MKHAQAQAPVYGPLEISTFGYHLASQNRISEDQLNDSLDLSIWPAIFVYDALQLPGTLANVLGHASGVDLIKHMTPAKYTAKDVEIDWTTAENESCIESHEIKGMIVLGRGRDNRTAIAKFYGDEYLRQTIDVEIGLDNGRRQIIKAYVWSPVHG